MTSLFLTGQDQALEYQHASSFYRIYKFIYSFLLSILQIETKTLTLYLICNSRTINII